MRNTHPHALASTLTLVLAACADKAAGDAASAITDDGHSSTSAASAEPTAASTTADGGSASTTGASTTGASTTGASTTSASTTSASTTDASTTSASTTGDPPGALACPESIDQGILECVAALQGDPDLGEQVFLFDLLWMCSDAEPVAVDYDAHCVAHPDDPICSLPYEDFVTDVLPQCVARVQQQLFADVCLLPATYAELLFTPGIALMGRRFVTDAADLEPVQQTQIVWASADMGFPVANASEALLATDDDGFEELTVLDVGTDRVLVAYTAHYGDTRVGRVFFNGSLALAGSVEDGEFTRCGVERVTEGSPCPDDMSCGPGFYCEGVLAVDGIAPGVCVSTDPPPGADECESHTDCAPHTGLLCLDNLGLGQPGHCRPGWMRRSFAGPKTPLVSGGTTKLPILVSGVATVPNISYLDLQLSQESANPLTIRLLNPSGTAMTAAQTDATQLVLDLKPVKTQSDESAGGLWHIEIEDIGGAANGSVSGVALTLDTRWD